MDIDYRADHPVDAIEPEAGGFVLKGAWGEIRAAKVVLAAGTRQRPIGPHGGAGRLR